MQTKGRWVFPLTAKHLEAFARLAEEVEAYQSEYPVRGEDVIKAVFALYNDPAKVYVNRITTSKVWKYYWEWENRRAIVVHEEPSLRDELDLLQHLCACRSETLQECWSALRQTDLFSGKFIRFANAHLGTKQRLSAIARPGSPARP